MSDDALRAQLDAAHCWFTVDHVAKDEQATAWKRRARLHQARWREAARLSIGTHPYRGAALRRNGKPPARVVPVGSRIAYGEATAADKPNFLTKAARDAALHRVGHKEEFETLNADRLWADCLSSMPLCFNLFGDLAASPEVAKQAVGAWWPDAPRANVVRVRFEHSPRRRDPKFLGNRTAFDVALELDLGGEQLGIIGVETKYHEHAAREDVPDRDALGRYADVTERSGVFVRGWADAVVGTDLQQLWLDHLLVLSMLQHESRRWTWGRYVLAVPAGNPSFAAAAKRYHAVLRDPRTFEARTLESLVGTAGALPAETANRFRARYLFSPRALPERGAPLTNGA